jgi:predicted CXXCH cytochrome family protein
VRAARLRLGPGRHQIRVVGRSLAVWVGGEPAPEGWQPSRQHPTAAGPDRCAGCHEKGLPGAPTAVGKALPPTACQACHQPAQFEVKHAHPLEPLRDCTSCHAAHGSPRKGLLKAPAKTLCAACHDS